MESFDKTIYDFELGSLVSAASLSIQIINVSAALLSLQINYSPLMWDTFLYQAAAASTSV